MKCLLTKKICCCWVWQSPFLTESSLRPRLWPFFPWQVESKILIKLNRGRRIPLWFMYYNTWNLGLLGIWHYIGIPDFWDQFILRKDFFSKFFGLQGSPFKLTGTFDGYYYKKYKSYKNFWYGIEKVILLEFRICPIFIDLTQIEGYRTVLSRFGCFVLRVTSNFEAVWGQYGLKNLLLCHYYSNTII